MLECKTILKALSVENSSRLIWVLDVPGNEEADRLARLGAQETPIGPKPFVGISESKATCSIGALATRLFDCRWVVAPANETGKGTDKWPQRSEN